MKKHQRWFEQVLDIFVENGGQVMELRTNGHLFAKLRFRNHVFGWTVSSSPSKQNAYRDAIADLKRELRRAGAQSVSFFKQVGPSASKMVLAFDEIVSASGNESESLRHLFCLLDLTLVEQSDPNLDSSESTRAAG